MNLVEGPNWTEKDPIYLFRENDNGKFITGEKVEVYGKSYWRWEIDKKSERFAFVYVNDWGPINGQDYYRTALTDVGVVFSQAGGKVFKGNGTAPGTIENRKVYALKDITAEIANKMPLYFYDFTGEVTDPVKVVYSSGSSFSTETAEATKSVKMNSVDGFPNLYTVAVSYTHLTLPTT